MKNIKKYILKRLGISELREKLDNSKKEIQKELQNESQELKKELKNQSQDLGAKIKSVESSLKESKNNNEKRLNDLTNHQGYLRKWIDEMRPQVQKIKRLERDANLMRDNRDELMQRVANLEKMVLMQNRGLNQQERESKIIVSLTSFPARIETTGAVIEQMLYQTVRPDEVVLWLSKDQFPEREKELPKKILDLRDKFGVKIGWCDGDVKAYKKFLPALEQYPEDLIIIIDDDLLYPIDLVEQLADAHKKFPNAIIASRVHRIGIDENGKMLSYKEWKKQIGDHTYEIKDDWFFTGGAGTLLPPHIFDKEIFNKKVILELCPLADDIWLNIHAAMNKVPIVNTAANNKLARIASTQEVCLQTANLEQNDVQLKNLTSYYSDQLKGTIYEKM